MIVKLTFIFILLFLGVFYLINIDFTFSHIKKPKKVKKIRTFKKIENIRKGFAYMLLITGSKVSLKQYFTLSFFLFIIGYTLGVIMNNILLSFVLSIGLPFFQFQLLTKKKYDMVRHYNEQLELNMSMVTNLYMQTGAIELAIIESYGRMNENETASKPFGTFIGQAAGNPDIRQCILEMKKDIDNPYFNQWCDKLALCHENYSIKNVLPHVVNRMRHRRILDAESVTNSYKNFKEFVWVCEIAVAYTLIVPQMNPMLKHVTTDTLIGKITTALFMMVILLTTAYVIKLNNPSGDKK